MKKGKGMTLLIAASVSSGMLAGCGAQGDANTETSQSKQEEDYVLSFVAADKTNWDKEVTIGEHTYTLVVNLDDDNTLKFVGTCTGEAEAETGNNMGPGGGMGGPGGGAPGGEANPEAGAPTQESQSETETETEPDSDSGDLSKYNFEMDGTWSYEDGWGYTLTLEDGQDTTVTANFDKASSRQYFYYNLAPTINGEKQEAGLVQFQAKDTKFRSEMAADYVIDEERKATYIFEGEGTTATGNASTIKIYCKNDGTVACMIQKGSESSYAVGTWTEDEKTHTMKISTTDGEFTADYCDIAGKEGYRVFMTASGGMGPSTTLTCYAAIADGVDVTTYTDADFEGKTVKTMTCKEGDYTIELTEKGFLKVKSADTVSETSTYTYDESSDTYTLIVGGQTYTVPNEGGTYTAEITITVRQMMGEQQMTRIFTCQ